MTALRVSLAGLAALSLLVTVAGCAFPLKLVEVTPEMLAREALQRGTDAQRRGDLSVAWQEYRAAIEHKRSQEDAWWALLSLSGGDRLDGLRREVEEWERGATDEPLPAFLLGCLTKGDQAVTWYRRAWKRSGGDYAPLLDPWVMRPRGRDGWMQYSALLESLEPATANRDVWLLLARAQLGDREAVVEGLARFPTDTPVPDETQASLDTAVPLDTVTPMDAAGTPMDRAGRALVDAALLEAGGDRGRHEEIRELLRRVIDETRDPFFRWEARRRLMRLGIVDGSMLQINGHLAELRRERRAPELDVLEASFLARHGRNEEARALLVDAVRDCVLPRVRLAGAVLLYRLEGENPPVTSRDQLLEAIPWALDIADLEHLVRVFITSGDASSAAKALAALIAWVDSAGLARSGRLDADLATLQGIGDARLLPAIWEFLRERPVSERRAAFSAIPENHQPQAALFALRHSDARLRTLAVGILRRDTTVPFADLPPLSGDPDARVRGAWLLLAADQGGEIARQAILAGRHDADSYVREIAAGLSLPK